MPTPPNNRPVMAPETLQAILLGLGAFAVWCLNDVGTKTVGKAHIPFLQLICLIAMGATAFLVTTNALRGDLRRLIPVDWKNQSIQGGITLIQSIVNVVTFTLLPLTTVYAALFTAPMISALQARFFLKEHLSKRQFFFIFVGFCGALIAVNPFAADLKGEASWGWVLLPLYPLLFATSTLFVRKLRRTDTAESVALFPSATRLLVFLPIAAQDWHAMPISLYLIALGAGALMGIGNLLFNTALAKAGPAIVAPLHYSQLIWGGLFGYLFWNDLPTPALLIGSCIIVGAGLAGARSSRTIADH